MRLDHVVLWVQDPLRSVDFFEHVVGLTPLRVQEFRDGKCSFPSVRVSEHSIIDLMARVAAPMLNGMAGKIHERVGNSAGHLVNHVCLAMTKAEFEALRTRLEESRAPIGGAMTNSFGAQGDAPHTYYFSDPDGNVLEARYYDE